MNKQFILFLIFFTGISSALLASGLMEQDSAEREFISVEYDAKYGAYCNETIVFNIKHNLEISSIIKIELELIWRNNALEQALQRFWNENVRGLTRGEYELLQEEIEERENNFIENFDHSKEELIKVEGKVYYFYPTQDITFEYWVGLGGWNEDIDEKLHEIMFDDISEEYFIILIWMNNYLIYENREFMVSCSSIF